MTSTFDTMDSRLRALPDAVVFIVGMAFVAGTAAFKVTPGHDIPVADFLLVPVAAVGWLARSRASGYLAAV